jgi:hypothetical protein
VIHTLIPRAARSSLKWIGEKHLKDKRMVVGLACRHCGSTETYRSRSRGVVFESFVLRLFNSRPYRCGRCDKRFYSRISQAASRDLTRDLPKRGERVRVGEQPDLFEVVDVNMLMQTANLKATDGQGHVIRNIAWTSLKFQSAAEDAYSEY